MEDIKQAFKDILKLDEKTGIPPEAFVIEECSELTKEIIKKNEEKVLETQLWMKLAT